MADITVDLMVNDIAYIRELACVLAEGSSEVHAPDRIEALARAIEVLADGVGNRLSEVIIRHNAS
jgi:hypothetical protein